jgi:hypothetical protein
MVGEKVVQAKASMKLESEGKLPLERYPIFGIDL